MPVPVNGGLTFTHIAVGDLHTCGIVTSGAAYCWGVNGQGQLGDNSWDPHSTPELVNGGHIFTSISTGVGISCAVTSDSKGYCWGRNDMGQLGVGDTNERLVPTEIAGGHLWAAVSTHVSSACGVTSLASVYCWGWGGDGQHGNNAGVNQEESPVLVWTRVETKETTVSLGISPSLTFTVSGRTSECNDQAPGNFETGSTGTLVNLGRATSAATSGGAQDLEAETNAANGFIVYLRTPGTTPNPLRNGSGNSIADVTGTAASPGAGPVAGTPGFGYTFSDALTNFTSNTWAKLTNSNDSVLIGNAGTLSKTACAGYQVAIDDSTPPGVYSVVVIYTAVPGY